MLERGYVIVDDGNGNIIRTKNHLPPHSKIILSFSDGKINATTDGEIQKKVKQSITKKKSKSSEQPDLF